MKKTTQLIYFTIILLFAGCGHTNELVKFNLNNKTFYFEDSVAPDAQKVKVDFNSPLKVNVNLNTGKTKTLGGLFSAISAVGSAIISSKTKDKLENALSGSKMASYVSSGIEKTLTQFYNIKNVGSLNNNPMFIVETELTKIQIGSTKDGVGVLVNAKSRIMDKKTDNSNNGKKRAVKLCLFTKQLLITILKQTQE